MNLKLRFILFSVLFSISSLYSQVTYEFCMTSKYGSTIVLDFKIHNNTPSPISDYNFIFDWKGVSNTIIWTGLDVIQNGDNGIVELRKSQWGNPLPVGTTTISVTMDYELGMFPPDSGILNGNPIIGITCYTPPAHENFKCERSFSNICTVKPIGPSGHEIKIGEGSAFAWNAPVQIYIPENKKSWAIGMAVSHALFTNLMGFDVMSINEYFATAIQESNAGCEGSKLIAPSWVTTQYPHHDTDRPIFCYDPSGAVAVGYFQQEMGGSWAEMNMNYPCFIPNVDRNDFIADPAVGSSFEFQALVKAYHDYRNVAFWQYVKCWNPIGFFKDAKDSYAAVKLIGMAYNQGMNHQSFDDIFNTNRTAAVDAVNLMDHITPGTPGSTNRLYAEQISRFTKVLDNKVADIDWNDAAEFGITDRTSHSFRDFYEDQFTWNDVEDYIKKITPFYTAFGVNEADFIKAIKPVFDNINGGQSISFRYQMADVIDAIIVYLPAFDPKKGLAEVYGGAGANGCYAPTARMEGINASCGDDLSLKVYFSGVAPYTFTYKRTDVYPEIIYQDITTSQNPYTITPVEEGTYALIAIRDNSGAGEVVCEPIEVKYDTEMASAVLKKYEGDACTGIGVGVEIEITSNATGPFMIEYEIDGIAQPAIITNDLKYTLISAPAPEGVYHLTQITVSGCTNPLDETLIIDSNPIAPVTDAKLIEYGSNFCAGIGSGIQIEITSTATAPYIIEYEIEGIAQPAVTTNDLLHTLIAAPAPEGTYHLTKITASGCETALDNSLIIDANPIAPVTDTKLIEYGSNFCAGTGSGVQIEITSTATAPFIIEYEINGIAQPTITTNDLLHTLIAAPAPEGTYHLTKITASGCETALDNSLVITPAPTAPATDAKLVEYGADFCAGIGSGVQIEITSTATAPYIIEYEIDGIAQPAVTTNDLLHTLIAASAPEGTYRLTKITASGCDTVLDNSLVITPAPTAPATDAKLVEYGSNFCAGIGSGVQIEITSTATAPFIIEYEINGIAQPAVATNDLLHTLIAAPAPEGTYHLTKITASGCETVLDNSLVITPAPTAPAADAKLVEYGSNFCAGIGSGVQIEITSTATAPYIIEYEIDGIAQPAVTTNDLLHTLIAAPAPEGTYHLTKITASGCETVLDNSLVITPAPTAPAADAKLVEYGADFCAGIGSGVQIEITSTATAPFIIEYEIDGIAQPAVTTNDVLHTLIAAPAPEGTYHLTKITASGCDTILDNTLIITPAPTAPVTDAKLIEYGSNFCAGIGSGVQIEITSTATAPYIIEYEIDGIAQPAVTTNDLLHTLLAAPAPEGTYRLTKITASGCETVLDNTLIIDSNPIAPVTDAKLIEYGSNFCAGIGSGVQIEITSTSSAPFIIEYEIDGIAQPAVTTNDLLHTLLAAPAPAGTYHLTKITASGCDTVLDNSLIINSNPIAPVTTAKLAEYCGTPCPGIGYGINVEITSTETGPFIIEYTIDGNQQPSVTTNDLLYNLIPAPADFGKYCLTKITTVSGCEINLNDCLTLTPAPLLPQASAKLIYIDEIACLANSELQVEITSNHNGPFVLEYSFNGVVQPKVTTSNLLHVLRVSPAAGEYKLISISIGNIRFPLVNQTIIVQPTVIPFISAKLVKFGGIQCVENPGIQIDITSNQSGPYIIQYDIDGEIQPNITVNTNPYILIASNAPNGTYRITKISNLNCDFDLNDKLVIKQEIAPKVKIEGALSICKGETSILRAFTSPSNTGIKSYQWKLNNTAIQGAVTDRFPVTKAGDYTVEITDQNGCASISQIATLQFKHRIECEDDIPKFFTPNGDGYNDTWHIKNLSKYKKAEIRIFDRYGKFLAQIAEHTPGWDGTYNGTSLHSTDYWFVMTYIDEEDSSEQKTYRGHFALKR